MGDRKRLLKHMDFLVEWGSVDENALILIVVAEVCAYTKKPLNFII